MLAIIIHSIHKNQVKNLQRGWHYTGARKTPAFQEITAQQEKYLDKCIREDHRLTLREVN